MKTNALQIFQNISKVNHKTLEDVHVIFRHEYVEAQSQITGKHKWHRLFFDPNTIKLPDFSEELFQGADKALGENALSMFDNLGKYGYEG